MTSQNNTAAILIASDRAVAIMASWSDDLPNATVGSVTWVLRCEGIDSDDALVADLVALIAARDAA